MPSDWLGLMTFEDPQLESMSVECEKFMIEVLSKSRARWLSLVGNSMTGKTHCARRIWKQIQAQCNWDPMECDYTPFFVYWPRFCDRLRDGGEAYPLFRAMQSWPYLALDDIGAERDTSGFVAEKLSTLLGCRTNKWTVITSNLTTQQLAAIDARIATRLRWPRSVLIELTCPPYAARIPATRQAQGAILSSKPA